MLLTRNEAQDVYLWGGREAEVQVLAKEAGLTLSTTASRSRGHNVYFTPEPHAVLHLWNHADEKARAALGPLRVEWERSNLNTAPPGFSVPVPEFCELMPFQLAGVHYAKDRSNCLIGDAPGLGKAQPLTAKVLTPAGWKRMGDLQVNDSVCTSYGTQARVTAIYDRGVMPVWRVTFNDGSATLCSDDHLWSVKTQGGARGMERNWFVAPLWEVRQRVEQGQRIQVPIAEPVFHAPKKLPVDPYLLGALIGDGGLTNQYRIMLSTADGELRDRCAEAAKKYGVEVVHSAAYDYRFNNNGALRARLEALGLMGKNSRGKFVPSQYLLAERNARLDLLRGLLDTDGWVTKQGDTGFASTSEQLAKDVVALVQSLGGTARKSAKKNANGEYWSVSINMPVCPFWLPRKADKWAPFEHYKPARWIKSIDYVGEEEVRCISVAAKDRLYITDDYIVTHNTIQAITLANLRGCKRVLVVCPANVRPQWARQIKIWSTIPKVVVYPVFKSTDGVHPTANYVITSFEVARDGLWDTLRSYNWDLLVIDEGHYLKTPDAARTRALFGASRQSKCRYAGTGGIAERADQIVALTGTPLPNRPRECFTLANALDASSIDWMNFNTFKDRFNPGGRDMDSGATWEYVARLPELNARLRCNIMVRRLKEDVLKDLPAKRYEIVPVETTGAIAAAVHAEKMLDFDEDEMLARSGGKIDGAISTVRRQMGEAMAPAVLEHILTLLDGGVEKLVVFAHHHSVLSGLQGGMARHGVIRVDGSTSARGKHQAVEKYKFDPRMKVFLGQMQAVGTGTDGLQDVATHCVFAEASWVPGDNEQCVDRLHRMGQKGSVLAQLMVAPGSISERILGRSISKGRTVHKVLDGAPV